MQYTLRDIPERLDALIREQAAREGRSLNQVAIAALMRAFGLSADPIRHRDLSDIAGRWVEDPVTERVLEDQRRVDADIWR